MVSGNSKEMLKGVLEGCVLELIDRGATYGYELTRELNNLGFDSVVEGTVYAILVRLEKGNLVVTEKTASKTGPMRKLYSLNDAGREQLALFWKKWNHIKETVNKLERFR